MAQILARLFMADKRTPPTAHRALVNNLGNGISAARSYSPFSGTAPFDLRRWRNLEMNHGTIANGSV